VKIVLDTNVVVSALLWGGTPYRLVEAAAAGDVELYTSPALMAELRDVLGREHLASRLAAQRSSVASAIALYSELAISVSPPTVRRVVPGDADDDQVIAAAVAAGADLIVTGDRQLLAVRTYQRSRIVGVTEALRALAT
jgi:putative PIN family toxin of toxin-antitoxin system